jgi:hypothetical protein
MMKYMNIEIYIFPLKFFFFFFLNSSMSFFKIFSFFFLFFNLEFIKKKKKMEKMKSYHNALNMKKYFSNCYQNFLKIFIQKKLKGFSVLYL